MTIHVVHFDGAFIRWLWLATSDCDTRLIDRPTTTYEARSCRTCPGTHWWGRRWSCPWAVPGWWRAACTWRPAPPPPRTTGSARRQLSTQTEKEHDVRTYSTTGSARRQLSAQRQRTWRQHVQKNRTRSAITCTWTCTCVHVMYMYM